MAMSEDRAKTTTAAPDRESAPAMARLRDSVDQLLKDVEKVEYWAAAVVGFSEPVPGYDFSRLPHLIPPTKDKR